MLKLYTERKRNYLKKFFLPDIDGCNRKYQSCVFFFFKFLWFYFINIWYKLELKFEPWTHLFLNYTNYIDTSRNCKFHSFPVWIFFFFFFFSLKSKRISDMYFLVFPRDQNGTVHYFWAIGRAFPSFWLDWGQEYFQHHHLITEMYDFYSFIIGTI